MELFNYNADTGLPEVDPIIFELKPFKKIYKRDKTKFKEKARSEIAFVWFYADYKSDFSSELDEDKKIKEIKAILSLKDTWKLDKDVKEAIEFYKGFTNTPTTELLSNTKKLIRKLSKFINDVEFDELDKNGKLKFDMKKIVDTSKQIPELISILESAEEKVKEEQSSLNEGVRGQKNLAVHEDGFNV